MDAFVGSSDPDAETWWTHQVVEVAQHHGYWADLAKFRHWVQIRLRVPQLGKSQTHIVISFHHKGNIAGLMAATAFLSTTVPKSTFDVNDDSAESSGEWETDVLSADPYTYSVSHREPGAGFTEWLEQVIDRGLDRWQSRI